VLKSYWSNETTELRETTQAAATNSDN